MTDRAEPTLMEQMGGGRGIVYSTVPVAVFIPANIIWSLNIALIVSLAAAAAILVWRLVKRENLTPAISGFMCVGLCALIAYATGEARNYYLYGIASLWFWGVAFMLSLVFRRPLVGVGWNYLQGRGSGWRSEPLAIRYYSIATAFWGATFLIRAVIQTYLYLQDEATLLGIVKIALGWPVAAIGVLVTIWAVRKAGHAQPKEDTADTESESEPTIQ